MIRGKDLILYVEINNALVPVCLAKDCELSISADTIETTTFGSLNWKGYDYTKKGATITHSGLTSFVKQQSALFFIKSLINSTKIGFSFSDFNNQGVEFSGTCIVNQTDITSPHDSISTFTASLTLTGPLVYEEKPIITILGLASEFAEKPQYCVNGLGSLFPVGVYNINNKYLGSAPNKATLVSIWNADVDNQVKGVLSITANDCQYKLTSTFNQDELPPYIIIDVNNYTPKYASVITYNQTVQQPTSTGNLSYSISISEVAVSSISWVFKTGPTVATINPSTGAYSGVTGIGVYEFDLVVSYVDGHIDSFPTYVTITPQTVFNSLIQWGYSPTSVYDSVVGGTPPTFQFSQLVSTNTRPFIADFTFSANLMYIYIAMPSDDEPFLTWENTGNNNGTFSIDGVMFDTFTADGLQYGMSRRPFLFDSVSYKLFF